MNIFTDEDIKEIVGPWGDTPIKGYTRSLFDKIEAKLREKQEVNTLRDAAQQALEALGSDNPDIQLRAAVTLRAALAESKSDTSSDYERGFIDGMQKQMQSSVDKAVNRMAALSEPQPEPVAWALRLGITQRVMVDFTENSLQADNWRDKQCDVIPLYTHPPQRQPLTDEQIVGIYETPKLAGTEFANGTEKAIAIFRAAERAHGIGGDK